MRRLTGLIVVGTLALAACASIEGDGNVVSERRTVPMFDAVSANNGVHVALTIDSTATGDVVLEVNTDSNLQDFLKTAVDGTKLRVSVDRSGGATPSNAFDVAGAVAAVDDVSVDNGARVEIIGSTGRVTLSADNGALFAGEGFEAGTVSVDADNGAQISICATGTVSGKATNGAKVTVLCGGKVTGVETSNGGSVSSTP